MVLFVDCFLSVVLVYICGEVLFFFGYDFEFCVVWDGFVYGWDKFWVLVFVVEEDDGVVELVVEVCFYWDYGMKGFFDFVVVGEYYYCCGFVGCWGGEVGFLVWGVKGDVEVVGGVVDGVVGVVEVDFGEEGEEEEGEGDVVGVEVG